jgi:hypothetical protein
LGRSLKGRRGEAAITQVLEEGATLDICDGDPWHALSERIGQGEGISPCEVLRPECLDHGGNLIAVDAIAVERRSIDDRDLRQDERRPSRGAAYQCGLGQDDSRPQHYSQTRNAAVHHDAEAQPCHAITHYTLPSLAKVLSKGRSASSASKRFCQLSDQNAELILIVEQRAIVLSSHLGVSSKLEVNSESICPAWL